MDIIERLEKAAAGSRELDAAIDLELGLPKMFRNSRVAGWWREGEWWSCSTDDGFKHLQAKPIGTWTRSLDAVLMLVPEHVDWLITSKVSIGVAAWVKMMPDLTTYESDYSNKTPALALCIAAMKARAKAGGAG